MPHTGILAAMSSQTIETIQYVTKFVNDNILNYFIKLNVFTQLQA